MGTWLQGWSRKYATRQLPWCSFGLGSVQGLGLAASALGRNTQGTRGFTRWPIGDRHRGRSWRLPKSVPPESAPVERTGVGSGEGSASGGQHLGPATRALGTVHAYHPGTHTIPVEHVFHRHPRGFSGACRTLARTVWPGSTASAPPRSPDLVAVWLAGSKGCPGLQVPERGVGGWGADLSCRPSQGAPPAFRLMIASQSPLEVGHGGGRE